MTRIPVLGLLALLTVACSDGPTAPQRAAVNAAEARWNALRIDSYRMSQRVACFCGNGGTTFQVTVSGGSISRVINLATGEALPVSEFTRFRTVAQLFGEIREAIRTEGKLTAVAYHVDAGYPMQVSLDPIKQAVDDEVTYLTENLVMLSQSVLSNSP